MFCPEKYTDNIFVLNRVLEIAEENRYISLDRGFIVIESKGEELGRIPLDDIAVLLLSAQSITFTKNIMNALAERGGISVFCGKNYVPQSIVTPVDIHTFHSKILKMQIDSSEPFKKKIWQQIVIRKIEHQSMVLELFGKNSLLVKKISKMVKSGDTDNREAYAARIYWTELFGDTFVRDKNGSEINAVLNYGYTIIRSAMIRAICTHGLEPALGIFHDNNQNSFCLSDDFFEVYRPIVDAIVYKLVQQGETELTPSVKKVLAKILNVIVNIRNEKTQIVQSMNIMVSSYVNALEAKNAFITLPEMEKDDYGTAIIESV